MCVCVCVCVCVCEINFFIYLASVQINFKPYTHEKTKCILWTQK